MQKDTALLYIYLVIPVFHLFILYPQALDWG